MAYTKHNFKNGDILHADDLNELEDQIIALGEEMKAPVHKTFRSKNGFAQFYSSPGSSYTIRPVSRNLLTNNMFTAQTPAEDGYYLKGQLSSCTFSSNMYATFADLGCTIPIYRMLDFGAHCVVQMKPLPHKYWISYKQCIHDEDLYSGTTDLTRDEVFLQRKQVVIGMCACYFTGLSDSVPASELTWLKEIAPLPEDEANEVKRRLELWADNHGVSRSELDGFDGYTQGKFFGSICLLDENGNLIKSPQMTPARTNMTVGDNNWISVTVPGGTLPDNYEESIALWITSPVDKNKNPVNFTICNLAVYEETDDLLTILDYSYNKRTYWDPPTEEKTIRYRTCGSNLALLFGSNDAGVFEDITLYDFISPSNHISTSVKLGNYTGAGSASLPPQKYIKRATRHTNQAITSDLINKNIDVALLSSDLDLNSDTGVTFSNPSEEIMYVWLGQRMSDLPAEMNLNSAYNPRLVLSTLNYPCTDPDSDQSISEYLTLTGASSDLNLTAQHHITTIMLVPEYSRSILNSETNTYSYSIVYPEIEIEYVSDTQNQLNSIQNNLGGLYELYNDLQYQSEKIRILSLQNDRILQVLSALTSTEIEDIINPPNP